MNDDPAKAKRQAMMVARGVTGKENLPMDLKSRLKRARAMGFDTRTVYYHGSDQDIKQFDPISPGGHAGAYISKDPGIADAYATKNQYNDTPTYGGNIMPLYAKKNAPIRTNQMAGYYKVNDPTELRSIHANFDPSEAGSPDLMKARGGMIDDNDKAIRRATMVAKGLAKEIGPLPTGDHPNPPHPASMIPGVHVTGMGDGPQTFADGGDVTSNPNFSQWFGNSVAHDNSVPRTYYTGTSKDKDFTSFNVGRHGAWFTTDPHEASQYAESNDSQGHVWENGRFQPINTAGRVIPAYLKAENPYTGERPEAINRAQNYKKAQSDWFDTLRAAGHDSWIPSSLKGNLAVMLRHPTQIKSAIGNSGAFDPKQKAIHKADGGDVEPTDETGFDAYHGSPHELPAERLIQHPTGEQKHILASQPVPEGAQVVKDYPLGRFRSDRIGTGAGEQAYGHGLYFAQAEPTAESYISNADWKYRGKRAENIYNDLYNHARERNLNGQGWDDLNAQRSFWERVVVGKAPRAIIEESKVYPEDYGENEKKYISTLNPKGFKRTGGHMYRVRVNANPEHFLDWDKPLGEQHPHVQQALSFLGLNPQDEGHPSRPGEAAYRAAVFQHGKDPAKASAALLAAGIPGIRYLNADSRDPNTGQPTHNHVVFDPSKITIKRRYARGGVVQNHPNPPHPASMIPGVHVTGMGDGPQTFADGGDVEPTDETGFDAYHGSPHEFAPEPGAPLGRFRSDKIGTGEGAQAFGHGLYFGEEPTAQRYKNTLRHRSVDPEYMSGVRSALASLDQPQQQNYDDALLSALTSNNQTALPKAPMGPDALPNFQAAARIFSAHDTNDHPIKVAQQIQAQFPHLRDEGSFLENGPKRLAIADQVEKMRERTKGHIYHVRVNANPEHFLDWDKPLSEQHPHVQNALMPFAQDRAKSMTEARQEILRRNAEGKSIRRLKRDQIEEYSKPVDPMSFTGEKLHGMTAVSLGAMRPGEKAQEATSALQAAGIPGIRYLDANSRDPNTGNPTHNHVVFDPSKITIKRRYARGGVVKKFAGGGDTGAGMNNDPMVQKALDGGSIVDRALTVARNAIKR